MQDKENEKLFFKPFQNIKPSPSFVDISLADPSNGELEFEMGLNKGAFPEDVHSGRMSNDTDTIHPELNFNESNPPPVPPKTMIGDWILGKTIGEGSSGKVKLAFHSITHETVCI